MKLNRKGFMLAEVVVSASVVAVVLVTMYIGINRMTAAYDKRNRYYDLDAQQVAMVVNDTIRNNGSDVTFDNSGILPSEQISSKYPETKELFDLYENNLKYNNNVYIVKNKDGFNNIKNSNINQSFKDYLDYFISKTNFDEDYSYFIVVELKKNDDYYYYTLKVK